jgi:predicted lipoprotein with Yx(FWY)xxD motif
MVRLASRSTSRPSGIGGAFTSAHTIGTALVIGALALTMAALLVPRSCATARAVRSTASTTTWPGPWRPTASTTAWTSGSRRRPWTRPTSRASTRSWSTLRTTDGTEQLAIDCWILYWYTGDEEPGDTNGHGAQELWWAVKSDGTKAAASS